MRGRRDASAQRHDLHERPTVAGHDDFTFPLHDLFTRESSSRIRLIDISRMRIRPRHSRPIRQV